MAKYSTKNKGIFFIVLTTIFTSSAQILYKIGSPKLGLSLSGTLFNYPIILGTLLYGIAAVLTIIAFRNGEVSVLYPILATSYIWVTLFSVFIFGEQLNVLKILGIASIFLGVILIGHRKNNKGVK